MTPFYLRYPKVVEENLRWRRLCGERALLDKGFRHAVYEACMEDVLFWMGSMCWVYEPRGRVKVRPFIPWPHQEEVFVRMDAAIDESVREEKPLDVLLDKSRAQGGTYGYLWIDLRRWLRDTMYAAGYVTRNELLVDSATDADTLFWKLAWGISRLPYWMLPRGFELKRHRNLSSHTILNPENGSMLVGYAAGQDVGAGGRKTVFTCDEFGARDFISGGKDEAVMESLHDVTNHIRLVSARYADSGVFHQACEDSDHGGVHLVLDWKDNPIHAKESYVVSGGRALARKVEEQGAVDAYHRQHPDLQKRLEHKGFKWEGVVRSPWYDARCLRPTSTPRLIASQLDRDPRGAVGKVFPGELLDRMKRERCRAPVWQGTPVFDGETLELKGLVTRDDGPLKLWFKPGPDFSCPLGPFTLGCDVAIGSDGAYSSNSVVSGLDDRTGEQVLEYTVNGVPMIKFARVVVGLAKWLRGALVGWEDSGMVAPFAKEILEVLYYPHVYYREVEAIGVKRKTRKPGWWNGKDEHKADLFEKLALGMETGRYVVRSEELIRECSEYEWEKGKIIHQPTKNKGAQEKAHGDRCLIAGTMIMTDCGERPIESLIQGDMVWTREGLRHVQVCGPTGFEPVFEVAFSNGRVLTGTGNHPVWTENRSWVELQSLRGNDILTPWKQHHQKQFVAESTSTSHPLKQWYSTGGCFAETQTPSRNIANGTSGEGLPMGMGRKSRFTSLFGSSITDLYRMATTCITRMAISSTTVLRTSRSSLSRSMGRSIKTARHSMQPAIQSCTTMCACDAERSTSHSVSAALSSAAKIAGLSIDGSRGRATKLAHASSVEQSIERTNTTAHRVAHQNAEGVSILGITKLAKPAMVYNLSVADTPEYFAQGVLVHNCIAAGVCWLVYGEGMGRNSLDKGGASEETPAYGSFLWREQRERKRVESDSPEFGIADVIAY